MHISMIVWSYKGSLVRAGVAANRTVQSMYPALSGNNSDLTSNLEQWAGEGCTVEIHV